MKGKNYYRLTKEWKETLFVQRLKTSIDLSESQIASLIGIIETTCNECWDSPSGCQCWNDE